MFSYRVGLKWVLTPNLPSAIPSFWFVQHFNLISSSINAIRDVVWAFIKTKMLCRWKRNLFRFHRVHDISSKNSRFKLNVVSDPSWLQKDIGGVDTPWLRRRDYQGFWRIRYVRYHSGHKHKYVPIKEKRAILKPQKKRQLSAEGQGVRGPNL